MFRADKPLEAFGTPSAQDWQEVKADGIQYRCPQPSLVFGSDRRVPVNTRPVISLRRENGYHYVLPCTGRYPPTPPGDFFELTEERFFPTRKWEPGQHSSAYYRAEVVPEQVLDKKTGMLTQAARLELAAWLRTRY